MIAYARPAMPRIGVISDTHGLVRPEALRALAGADLIVHAGDVGTPEVLEALRAVAPVVAVRGNNDRGRWARALAETEVVERSGRSLYVLHDLHELDLDPRAAGFDVATDEFMAWVGLDGAHRASRAITTFCLEAHVTYHREVRAGDPLRFTTQLLGHDAKRLHYIHAMYHAAEGWLAATNELMSLHVALETRRGATMAPEILARLRDIQAAHGALPR